MKKWLTFLAMMLLSIPSHGGSKMENEKYDNRFAAVLEYFCEDLGCKDALIAEKRDGLIMIDFRKIPAPHFVTEWPIIEEPTSPEFDNWSFSKNKREKGKFFGFHWRTLGNKGKLAISAGVCENYELAQEMLSSKFLSSNMNPPPWVKCSKKIGTVCARTSDKQMIFFVYKNVEIEISRLDYATGHEGFAEEMAEWLFDVLKAHPLSPMLPSGPLTFIKALYPAPETGYWKAYLPPDLAPEYAPRVNFLPPRRLEAGQTLIDLGLGAQREHLIWLWLGDYADEQTAAYAGMHAAQVYESRRKNDEF